MRSDSGILWLDKIKHVFIGSGSNSGLLSVFRWFFFLILWFFSGLPFDLFDLVVYGKHFLSLCKWSFIILQIDSWMDSHWTDEIHRDPNLRARWWWFRWMGTIKYRLNNVHYWTIGDGAKMEWTRKEGGRGGRRQEEMKTGSSVIFISLFNLASFFFCVHVPVFFLRDR